MNRSALGPLRALLLLLAPVWVAVDTANRLADRIDPWIRARTEPLTELLTSWPQPFAAILAGDYGFVTMGPLLRPCCIGWARCKPRRPSSSR